MSGGIGRKRARSEDGDDVGVNENVPIDGNGNGAGPGATGTTKRQRLAPSSSTASIVNVNASDDAALFPGGNIATTPQTPRTVHAVASAITGALAYGVGSLVGASKGRGKGAAGSDRLLPRPFKSLLNERNARITQDDLDKLYDVPGDDEEDNNTGAANGASLPVADSDVENTLVGSVSPTPDTPTKKQTLSASAKNIATDKKKKRRDLLEDLAIDGTDKMAAGLDGGSLSRRNRVRSTPNKYIDSEAAATGSITKSRSRSKAANGGASAETSPAPTAAALETAVAPPTPVAPAAGMEPVAVEASLVPMPPAEGASVTASTRRRARSTTASKDASTTETPTKAPSSSRRKTPAKADTANGETGTPASAKRSRTRPTPAKTADKPAPKRAPRAKSAPKNAEPKDTSTEQPQQETAVTQADKAVVEGEDSNNDDVCAICSKPDSEPPNEIIFCETCDLAVHQQCYNVPVIPEGDWFCKNCLRQQKEKEKSASVDAEAQQTDAAEEESAEDVAAKAAAAAAGDLAPDIANFEHHLAEMKRVLLGRCTGRQRVRLQGQDEAFDKAYQVVKQTVVAGEGNSMMVIGARGTGKTTMVESILGDLATEHGGAFHVVRLNGFIHTDDKLALREIWRQLGKEMAVEDDVVNKTNNYADTLASLLALLSHPSEILAATIGTGAVEKDCEAPAAVTSTAVVFVIDEFDLFATHARQTLLYNLFDIAQARKAPIAVLGLTTKIDVVESLEKRVKSRFSHRYVYLPLARSLPAFWDICRHGLVVEEDDDKKDITELRPVDIGSMDVDEKEGHTEFRQWWKHMIDTAKDDDHFQEQLAFHFYSTKSVPAFWTTCIMPLAAVSSTAPRLQLPPVGVSSLSGGGGLFGGASAAPEVTRTVGRPSLASLAAASAAKTRKTTLDDIEPLPLAPPDSKLHLLASLSELELSLLIAAARLDIVLSTDTVNFAMAYDEYVSLMSRQRVQSSLAGSGVGSGRGVGRPPGGGGAGTVGGTVVGGGARVWGRGVASRAWERLAALSLLIPAGMGASARARGPGRPSNALVTSGLEGRSMWRTEIALEEIAAAPGVRLGAVLARWCKEI
ncbi:origin recognition complex subunit 4 [Sporothrix stenoceras]|uniref:Origin recognition complex subunit 4 n=1 Tax=Sporothrix stenoceras TaxID=5173 RepID=A0ABR3ZS46_9PEZI